MSERTRGVVFLSEWNASNDKAPRGRGGWMFRNIETGEEITRCGTYTEARRAVPAGDWMLLP